MNCMDNVQIWVYKLSTHKNDTFYTKYVKLEMWWVPMANRNELYQLIVHNEDLQLYKFAYAQIDRVILELWSNKKHCDVVQTVNWFQPMDFMWVLYWLCNCWNTWIIFPTGTLAYHSCCFVPGSILKCALVSSYLTFGNVIKLYEIPPLNYVNNDSSYFHFLSYMN